MFTPSDNAEAGYPSREEAGVWLFNILQYTGHIDLTISLGYVIFLGVVGGGWVDHHPTLRALFGGRPVARPADAPSASAATRCPASTTSSCRASRRCPA